MDVWFQMVLSRSRCWPSIKSLALTGAEKWNLTQKLSLKVFEPRSGTSEMPKFCTGRSGGFSPGTPGFAHL